MTQHRTEDVLERLLAARALALALNPTLEREEIAHRVLELAGTAREPLTRALGRLLIRSLDSPSRVADRATAALRRALELQAGDDTPDVPRFSRGLHRAGGRLPLGPAA